MRELDLCLLLSKMNTVHISLYCEIQEKNLTSVDFFSLLGHQSFMAPSCSVLHCPAACTCSNNIVDCRGKGLTEIPTNLPETITEMYVPRIFSFSFYLPINPMHGLLSGNLGSSGISN